MGKLIRRGDTKSCGCWKTEVLKSKNTTHGLTRNDGDGLYYVWKNMIDRCINEKSWAYKWYGQRGISVCNEWQDVTIFHKWAVNNKYSAGLQLDRINNDGNYCPENCEWVTGNKNRSHTRATMYISVNGIIKSRKEWSKIMGVSAPCIDWWFSVGEERSKDQFSKKLGFNVTDISSSKREIFKILV